MQSNFSPLLEHDSCPEQTVDVLLESYYRYTTEPYLQYPIALESRAETLRGTLLNHIYSIQWRYTVELTPYESPLLAPCLQLVLERKQPLIPSASLKIRFFGSRLLRPKHPRYPRA